MKNKFLLNLFALILFLLPIEASAYACACCAEPGTYSISVRKPDKSEMEILKEIQFATANLFTNAAYPDNIKGISALGKNYLVNAMFQNNAWKFNFTDDKKKSGTLSLPLPTTMVTFMADIHDRDQNQSAEPVLYKEWRFKYRVRQGTGVFQNGIAPATEYFLVLQGRGNNCSNLSDFKNWRLEITGRKASFAFYGKLKGN